MAKGVIKLSIFRERFYAPGIIWGALNGTIVILIRKTHRGEDKEKMTMWPQRQRLNDVATSQHMPGAIRS